MFSRRDSLRDPTLGALTLTLIVLCAANAMADEPPKEASAVGQMVVSGKVLDADGKQCSVEILRQAKIDAPQK